MMKKRDGSMRLFGAFSIILLIFGTLSILLPHTALPGYDQVTGAGAALSFLPSRSVSKAATAAGAAAPSGGDSSSSGSNNVHKLAGLSCGKYGGPADATAAEMVYWEDIPSDSTFVSPFYRKDSYLTFEADEGGWNNIRMAMETVLALAFAMGRTLVLPPEKEMYLLTKATGKHGEQKKTFSFNDFFHMDAIHNEHVGLNIITMKEFLETVAMQGQLVDVTTGQVTYPPDRITDWDGRRDIDRLNTWLRNAGLMAHWNPEQCIGTFPASTNEADVQALQSLETQILADKAKLPNWQDYVGKPVPLDAPVLDRLKENWAERSHLCAYTMPPCNKPTWYILPLTIRYICDSSCTFTPLSFSKTTRSTCS
jgi:hypothetical protein